ncbi:MAG: hypothetical protein HZC04_02235 [Candidatus Lloydbacteria bacterium]|nr:hypothetical protein [Candidatus Lloydbacteria bacterium]
MDKKISRDILIVIILILIVGGFYYWKTKINKPAEAPKSPTEQTVADIQKTAADVSANIGKNVSPNVTTPTVNPIKADINPYNTANPYSKLKTNPFQ